MLQKATKTGFSSLCCSTFPLTGKCVRFSFFSIASQEIGLVKRLRNDLFCVEWDVKQLRLNQSTHPAADFCTWNITEFNTLVHDTIRDAILTCAQKLTRVSLIYRTEPTTKKWKTGKLKSKKRICSDVSVNSPRSQFWRRKGRLQREGFAEKECFVLRLGKKEWGLMEY